MTQGGDEGLASVNTVRFFEFKKNMEIIDSIVVLSFSKMIVRNYVGIKACKFCHKTGICSFERTYISLRSQLHVRCR